MNDSQSVSTENCTLGQQSHTSYMQKFNSHRSISKNKHQVDLIVCERGNWDNLRGQIWEKKKKDRVRRRESHLVLEAPFYEAERGKAGTELRDRGCFAAHTRTAECTLSKNRVCLQECGDEGAEFTPTAPVGWVQHRSYSVCISRLAFDAQWPWKKKVDHFLLFFLSTKGPWRIEHLN